MSSLRKSGAALFGALWMTYGAAAAAVITSSDDAFPTSDAFVVLTLHDRPLDAFAKIAPTTPYDVRPRSDFDDNYADTIGDGLFFAPGVTVNALDLKEPRIIIRGFGQSNIHQRSTVVALRDGAPLTDVHGTTNTSDIDILSAERIEILRAGTTLRPGPDSLGGAVNIVSRRGYSTPSGATGRIDGAASIDGQPGGQAHVALAGGTESSKFDYYAGVTGAYELGFRDNNRRTSEQFHGNLGIKPSGRFATRFFLSVINSTTDLAGGLELADLLNDPQNATPPIQLGPLFPGGPTFTLVDGAGADDFSRDIREARIANQSKLTFIGHEFSLGAHFTRREIESPQIDFIGFLEEEGNEWGATLEVGRSIGFFGKEAAYRLGGSYTSGTRSADGFENLGGQRGDIVFLSEQSSKYITGFVEGVYEPLNFLTVDLGAKVTNVDRSVIDTQFVGGAGDDQSFTGIAARLGAALDVTDHMQFFASASRNYEPPTMSELTAEDPLNFSSIDDQRAFAIEAGLRGTLGNWMAWDVAAFDIRAENEIINMGDTASIVSGSVFENVDNTTHKGVEAAIDVKLAPGMFERQNAALTWRSVYHFSDFRFGESTGSLQGNRIAGIPMHHYRGELRYDVAEKWFVAANVQVNAGDYFADHVNQVSVPTDTIVGFSAGLKLNDNMEVFASGENLTNSAYVAGITPIESQLGDQARIFAPGPPLSLYGGLRVRF